MRKLALALLAALAVAGCGSPSHHQGQLASPIGISGVPAGQTGIDLSNNDPSYGSWATIRRHESFVYLKVSEGTGFVDGTAARMAKEARAAGLLVGGYDFQHVCQDGAIGEARVFVDAARSDGLLTGPGVLPPTADFEFGGGCNARAWLGAWSAYVRRYAPDAVYSDPGFYSPELGCFSGADYGWVADLGGFTSLCGLRTVFWQFSWNQWDGVANVDGDVFRGSYAQLQALAHAVSPAVIARQRHAHLVADYRLRTKLRALEAKHHCRQPPFHAAKPVSYEHACHTWVLHGRQVNADIARLHRR